MNTGNIEELKNALRESFEKQLDELELPTGKGSSFKIALGIEETSDFKGSDKECLVHAANLAVDTLRNRIDEEHFSCFLLIAARRDPLESNVYFPYYSPSNNAEETHRLRHLLEHHLKAVSDKEDRC